MSHNDVLVSSTSQERLRDIFSASSKPARPRRRVVGLKDNKAIGTKLSQGQTVFDYAKIHMGKDVGGNRYCGRNSVVQYISFPRRVGGHTKFHI